MFDRLKNLFSGKDSQQEGSAFQSKFGGLWVDKINAEEDLTKRAEAEKYSSSLKSALAAFMADGYVVLPGVVPAADTDKLAAVIAAAYSDGDSRLFYHTDGLANHVPVAGTDPRGKRIVESHAILPEVRAALSAPALIEFLTVLFDEPPVLTQSLIFQTGSEQGYHQDPAFVVYDDPLRMAACWIALEDIEEGSGELRYLVKSHLLPDYIFSTGRRDSHGANPDEVQPFLDWIISESTKRNLKEKTFLARKGDVLVWHANLVHGGSPVTQPNLTRQSLVGHFCPSSVYPVYPNAKVRRQDGVLNYSSYIYQLANPTQTGSNT